MRIAAALSSSGKWHHAKRTHVITTSHDGDECGDSVGIQPDWSNVCVGFLAGKESVDALLSIFSGRDQIGQIPIGVWADDHVYDFFLLKEVFFRSLGHAAEYPDGQFRFSLFGPLKISEALSYSQLGFFTNRTGIQKDHIGLQKVRSSIKTILLHDGSDDLRI